MGDARFGPVAAAVIRNRIWVATIVRPDDLSRAWGMRQRALTADSLAVTFEGPTESPPSRSGSPTLVMDPGGDRNKPAAVRRRAG
jgi:hypothetical protein